MKKGQRVRILRDNTIGTIADITFFKLNGQKHIRYQVVTRTERKECWYSEEQLGNVTEVIKVSITAENGQEVYANITRNYNKENLEIKITGNPENLKVHKGLHMIVMTCLIKGLGEK